jgi:type V secretory pathway adhesin AidA
MSGNAGNGIHAITAAGHAAAFAIVERSSMVNNGANGILADGPGATLLLSDSTVSRNGAGITTVNGGQLFSYGTNRINNNIGPDGAPTGFLTLD